MQIRKLNTLRGIGALIVVVSHYSNETKLLNGILGKGAGQLGVMLFFLLSGFLMSYLYMGKEFKRHEVFGYALARIARVAPLFMIVVLISYLLCKFGFNGILYNISTKESLFSHLGLLSGTSLLWTIPAEIHFYLVFVFLWWFWRKRQAQVYILISILMVILVFLRFPRFQGTFSGIPYDFALIQSLPYFLVGVIFGQVYGKLKSFKNLSSRFYVSSILLILLLYPAIFTFLTGHNHKMWKDVGILFTLSLTFFLITFLVPDNFALISNPIGDFLGKISYSVYLLHIPILYQIKDQTIESPVLFFPIFLALTIIVSYLSFIIIENPSRRFIRALASKKRRL